LKNSSDVLKETIQVKSGKVEFSREVDEETNELTASSKSTVVVFVISPETKKKILEQFLSGESGFSESQLNPDSFELTLKINKLESDKATASLTIKGSSLPKFDISSLQKKLTGKTFNNAQKIIKKTNIRVYDFDFKSNFKFLNLLPLNSKNIIIETKIKSK
jgi:hypothetical protein